MTVCGAYNVDNPDLTCELAPGHQQLWRFGAWQDHGAPSRNVYWTQPPYSETDAETVVNVARLARSNPHLKALLMEHLADDAPAYNPPTALIPAIGIGQQTLDLPEYRAAGYTVLAPRPEPGR